MGLPEGACKNNWNIKIMAAVAAFVVFDFASLMIHHRVAAQIESDAVAINLAGRQRMLSQQVTKASVLALHPTRSTDDSQQDIQEAGAAYELFRSTLSAFSVGGEVMGSNGRRVMLAQVKGEAALLVGDVRGLTSPWPSAPTTREEMAGFSRFMVAHNESILNAMNQFTSALESQSRDSVFFLRIAQILTFSLSLANFFLILFLMNCARRRAVSDSMTDALTGLHNRAGLYGTLASMIGNAERNKSSLGILLLDLDGFKAVNDTHGHSAGDEVLREVAHRLLTWVRPGWVCARLGGDEFAVICVDVAAEQLAHYTSDLSKILSGIPAEDLVVSASVGASVFLPGDDADTMIARADTSMYEDKSRKIKCGFFRETRR